MLVYSTRKTKNKPEQHNDIETIHTRKNSNYSITRRESDDSYVYQPFHFNDDSENLKYIVCHKNLLNTMMKTTMMKMKLITDK